MLDRCTVDDGIIFAEQRGKKREAKRGRKREAKANMTDAKTKSTKIGKAKTDSSKKVPMSDAVKKFSLKTKEADTAGRAHLLDDVLFFRNAPLSESKVKLKKLFQQAGRIHDIRLLKDPMNNQLLGSGYVHCGSAEIAQKALKKLAGMDLQGQKLDITFCKKLIQPKASVAI